jgi:hypothetical protein
MRNLSVTKVATWLSWIIALVLILLPLHAFLTVWTSSLVGYYTAMRLWKEFLLLILVVGATSIVLKDAALRKKMQSLLIAQLIVFYILISVVWGVASYLAHKVTLKALEYGLIIDLRFLIFFLVVLIAASKNTMLRQAWTKIVLFPALAVIVIGILQELVLPYDFLKHFGYSSNTIFPYETINDNINYIRVMSTLRGANPLGAYLILVISAIAGLLLRNKRRRLEGGILLAGAVLVLVFSYSRSAWMGAALSLIVLAFMSTSLDKIKRIAIPALGAVLIAGTVLILFHRHNATFENIFFHTQTNSAIKTTSDQGHASAFKAGVHNLVHEPLGRGVGTAGPASVYNNSQSRLSENYYLQIAQEIGWVGLIVFAAINYLVACELWARRNDLLARVLFASLIGITFVSLLSHAWADDTLAYIWWGLAGIALAPIITDRQKAYGKKIKAKS